MEQILGSQERDALKTRGDASADFFGEAKLEDDLFHFTPLTEGLGFHHKVDVPLVNKSTSPKIIKPEKHRELKGGLAIDKHLNAPRSSQEIVHDFTKQQLALKKGVELQRTRKVSEQLDFIPKAPLYEEASFPETLSAWLIDMALISFLFLALFTLTILAVGLEWKTLEALLLFQENILVMFYLFLVFKFLYFTLFNLESTLGKSLLKLKLVKSDQRAIDLKQSAIRSLVGTLSLFALGLPFFLGWVDKLTDTKVINLKK